MMSVVKDPFVEHHFPENHRFEGFAESSQISRSEIENDASTQNSIVLPGLHSGRGKI
jgi:hypothetical protein